MSSMKGQQIMEGIEERGGLLETKQSSRYVLVSPE
jgi:hypothetical protein